MNYSAATILYILQSAETKVGCTEKDCISESY
jgi:hypothetical protein